MTSPDYYVIFGITQPNGDPADVGDLIDAFGLNYWTGGAVAHVLRAGRKPGETALDAIDNAIGCLERERERLKREEEGGGPVG